MGGFEFSDVEEFGELFDDFIDFIEDTEDGLPDGLSGDGWCGDGRCGDGRFEAERSGDGLDNKSNVGILNSEILLFDFFSFLGIVGFGNFGDIEDDFGAVM